VSRLDPSTPAEPADAAMMRRRMDDLAETNRALREAIRSLQQQGKNHAERLNQLSLLVRSQRDRLDRLEAVLFEDRRVEHYVTGGIELFAFSADVAADRLRAAEARGTSNQDPLAIATGTLRGFIDAAAALADHASGHVRVLDVGCHYGVFSMRLVRTLRARGLDAAVLAVDPGLAGTLCNINLEINGLDDAVEFVRTAAAERDGFTRIFRETGRLANNRMINRTANQEIDSRPVRCRRIDSLCAERGWNAPLAVKIDTQGAEPEVLRGMGDLLPQCLVVMEFAPQAIGTRTDPAALLRGLCASHHVLAKLGGERLREVEADEAGEVTEQIRATESHWDDLLLVPRGRSWTETALEAVR